MSNSNIHKRLSQEQAGTLHVGVDLAWEKNVITVIDEQAKCYDRFTFPHTRDGYEYMSSRLEKIRQKMGSKKLVVVMEPTNFFWKLLANYLESKGIEYRLVNAFTVNKHREGDQLDRSKDDPRDAFVIADLSRTGKYTGTQLQRGVYAELRNYSTLYYQLSKNIRREKSILWGLIGQVFPELRQAFKELSGVTVDALLKTCPAAVTIRAFTEEEFIQRVQSAFAGKRITRNKLRYAYRLAQNSIGLADGIASNALAIRVHLQYLERLQKDMLELIVTLKSCLGQIESAPFILTIKGLNTLSVALILAEIGDTRLYTSAHQLVKLSGIQPVPNRSGNKQSGSTPMSHQGRPHLRFVLYLACLRLIQINSQFKEEYHRLKNRSQNPLASMQAIGSLMNKLLHIIWALIRDQTAYKPIPHLAA